MSAPKRPKLDARMQRFAEEYIIDLNGAAAAQRAGYAGSVAVRAVQASRLLRNPNVAARIQELREKQAARTGVTADQVIRELANLALCDIGQAFRADGSLKPLSEMPEEVRRAISAVEVETRTETEDEDEVAIVQTKKVKFWSKNDALHQLGQHLGLFVQRLKIEDTPTGPGDLAGVPTDALKARLAELRKRPSTTPTNPPTTPKG